MRLDHFMNKNTVENIVTSGTIKTIKENSEQT